jgi:PTH1 family peptidyl-tRNA hydrolase
MKFIIGLGNPGKKYENTRHNVGFMAIDALAEELGLTWKTDKKFNAQICETPSLAKEGKKLILVKPLTYMNNSGQAVQAIMSYFNVLPKKIGFFKKKDSDLSDILTVIHDDIDIDLGKYKISEDSRAAGHKGIQSIINYLKTKNFKRIRVGIRTGDVKKIPTEKFVLQKFRPEEEKNIIKIIDEIKKEADIF